LLCAIGHIEMHKNACFRGGKCSVKFSPYIMFLHSLIKIPFIGALISTELVAFFAQMIKEQRFKLLQKKI